MASTREQLKQATQLRVINAACRLFQERGFTATTVRDIAEASDVSAGRVMAVGDKNSLLVSVFDMIVAAEHNQRAGTDTRSTDVDGGTCIDRLTLLVQPFIELFTGNSDLARVYASILVSGDYSSSLFTDLADRLITEFQAAITVRECTAQIDAPARASALYLAYVGTLFTWPVRISTESAELSASLRTTFAAICPCKE